MALATFSLFYNNPELFERGATKIRRGLAVRLILEAKDMESIKKIYFKYAMEISSKSRKELGKNLADQSFNDISIACANVISK